MDAQEAIERITETENLTDGLEDDDADWLLNWGIKLVPEVLQRAGKDKDAAGNAVNSLMAIIRSINKITSDREFMTADALTTDILALADQYAATFGTTNTLEPEALEKAAAAIHKATPHDAIQHLINLVQPAPGDTKTV